MLFYCFKMAGMKNLRLSNQNDFPYQMV